MDKDDIYKTFEIRDFVSICNGMRLPEILCYANDLMDSIERLDLSPKGFYEGKADTIKRLYRFLKGLVFYANYRHRPAGCDATEIASMDIVLERARI